MKTKHTEGPWRVLAQRNAKRGLFVFDASDYCIAALGDVTATQLANARLIAEAPALLDALRTLLALQDDIAAEDVDTFEWQSACDVARLAILRAERRSILDRKMIDKKDELLNALDTMLFAVTTDADNNDGKVDRAAVREIVLKAKQRVRELKS